MAARTSRRRSGKGLSLSMNFVVVALIVSVIAILVLGAFSGQFGSVMDFVGGSIGDAEQDLAAEDCLSDFERLCNKASYDSDSTAWADDATYNEKSCRQWINEGALGGEVKECGESYDG